MDKKLIIIILLFIVLVSLYFFRQAGDKSISGTGIRVSDNPAVSNNKTDPYQGPSGILGDINRDNKIDLQDLSLLLFRWGKKPDVDVLKADLNSDRAVNLTDYNLMIDILRGNRIILSNKLQ